MIDKKKFKEFNKITVAIILLFLIFSTFKLSLAKFETESSGKIVGNIAFYVLEAGSDDGSLKMFELDPDDKKYSYNISVQNYKGNKISEVDLEYTMSIKTTTNIPVEYELYNVKDMNTNILGQKEIIKDKDGMYFFKFNSSSGNFTHGVKESENYTLIITYPSSSKNEAYQGNIDSIEVSINSNQV